MGFTDVLETFRRRRSRAKFSEKNLLLYSKGRASLLNNLNVLISVENKDLNFKINSCFTQCLLCTLMSQMEIRRMERISLFRI